MRHRWLVVLMIVGVFSACNRDRKKPEPTLVTASEIGPNKPEMEQNRRIEQLEQLVKNLERQNESRKYSDEENNRRHSAHQANIELLWREVDRRPAPEVPGKGKADPELVKLWPLIQKKMPGLYTTWNRLQLGFGPASFGEGWSREIYVSRKFTFERLPFAEEFQKFIVEGDTIYSTDRQHAASLLGDIVFSPDRKKYISLNGGDDCPIFSLVDLERKTTSTFNPCNSTADARRTEGFWLDNQVFVTGYSVSSIDEDVPYQLFLEEWDFARNRVTSWAGPSVQSRYFKAIESNGY